MRISNAGICSLFLIAALTLTGCLGGSEDPSGPEVMNGTVSGRVIEPASGDPIVGAMVTLASVGGQKTRIAATSTTTTDENGEFWFLDVTPGDYVLTVDASAVVVDPTNPDLEYADYSTQVSVGAGQTTSADGYAPVVDVSQSATVTPGQPTVLQPEGIPGLRIEIDADAVTFPDGSHGGDLNVVQLGFDQGPAPLPHAMVPAMMIKIVPEGTTFDPPARIQFPNRDEAPQGRAMELFSFDLTGNAWTAEGGATSLGDVVASNSGVGIDVASTHFVVCNAHTVIGRVVDQSEVGVANATVKLWALVNPFGHGSDLVPLEGTSTTTATDGGYTFSNVRACNVSVSAVLDTPEGFGEIEPGDPIQAGAEGTTEIGTRVMEVVTETRFAVAGTVRLADGTPVSGARVEVFDPSGSGTAQQWLTESGVEGHYEFAEVTGDPGQQLGIYAYQASSNLGGEMMFQVPELSQSGTLLTVDITICNNPEAVLCGEWGTWSVAGNTMQVVSYEVVCGETQVDEEQMTLLSLVDGVLTLQMEENGQMETVVFSRVQGSGPSGISAANMVGIYADGFDEAYLALFADGTWSWIDSSSEQPSLQHGTYTATASQITVTFLFSTEPDTPTEPYTFDYILSGDTMTFINPGEENDVFERCEHGFASGAEGVWGTTHSNNDGLNLIIYRGEFAAAGFRAQ
jgi:protocatechuate 3,4-dioxygenase beta subunit